MKKRLLMTLLSLILTAGMLSACGNNASQSMAAETDQSAAEESVEESVEEIAGVPEEVAPTAEPEAEIKEVEQNDAAEATPVPTQTPQEASSEKETEEVAAAPADTQAPAEEFPADSQESTVASDPVETQAPAYTVTEMSATMYAQSAVNLRQGPGTEYAKIGALASGQQVTVTGQASTGWYQLDNGAFVSNKYLSTSAPAQQVATQGTADQTVVDPSVPAQTDSVTVGGTNSVDLVNYMNQQRVAAGLGAMAWDDGLASIARARADQLASNYSHDGAQTAENIQDSSSSSYVDWYNAWEASPGHKAGMFSTTYDQTACAYSCVNGHYFIVQVFNASQASIDAVRENMVEADTSENGVTIKMPQEQIDALEQQGESITLDPNNPDDAAIINKIEEENKKIDEGITEENWLN